MKLVYDVAHNIAKVEKHKIDGKLKSVVVHRKGATRAFPANMDDVPAQYRDLGQPVLVPGSMGTGSWILLGQENSMNTTFGSTAHGAGRMMSRTKARRNFTESEAKKSLSDKGIFLKSLTRDGVVEETPEAYKDVDAVVNVSHELGIATKVAKLVPVGVIKGLAKIRIWKDFRQNAWKICEKIFLLNRRKKKSPHHKKNKKIRNHLHVRLSSSG